jgi:hypothetical protein
MKYCTMPPVPVPDPFPKVGISKLALLDRLGRPWFVDSTRYHHVRLCPSSSKKLVKE